MDAVQSANILIIDDDPDVLLAAGIVLRKEFGNIHTANDPQQLERLLAEQDMDVVLLDMNYVAGVTSGREGLDWLRFIRAAAPATNVVLMTAYGGLTLAIEAIKAGASDFVVKPWDNAKLIATVHAALRHSRSQREVNQLKTRQRLVNHYLGQDFGQIVGKSEALGAVLATIDKVAATDASVLILGENGTGKELVARALHNQSQRADQPFVSVDLGAVPDSLFESELFGHVKGAFTDARSDRPGRIEVANGGTLFLDEIGNIPLSMQAKLLGVLQTRQLIRVGSNRSIPVDLRLVAATNMPLHTMVAEQRFRQDLLYRINTVEIHIPPLRERPGDIPLLAEHFAALYARKYRKPGLGIDKDTLRKLQGHSWPGNIRELQHAVERAVIMGDGETLQPRDFLLQAGPGAAPGVAPVSLNLEDMERDTIRRALEKHRQNLSRAAGELGLSRATLYRKMEKYGI